SPNSDLPPAAWPASPAPSASTSSTGAACRAPRSRRRRKRRRRRRKRRKRRKKQRQKQGRKRRRTRMRMKERRSWRGMGTPRDPPRSHRQEPEWGWSMTPAWRSTGTPGTASTPSARSACPRVLQRLQELGLAQRCLPLPSRPASPRQLHACHTRAHVRTLSRTPSLSPRELRALSQRYNSVYLCPQSYTCARLAAGGACAAVGAVLRGQVRSALAVLRPPGHHARPSSAGGFCLFNNVGVAVRHAQRLAGTPLRVLILDWDVHHGNGTQEIFEEDPSLGQSWCWCRPGSTRGAGGTLWGGAWCPPRPSAS
ncbi:histone deacetylase 6-like, partial [Poecile atricapillus]|uniref:histone deacetylase 6-like n=1 Tax=Poecile atricapillus TaxID=48891 RepID=UPI002738A433